MVTWSDKCGTCVAGMESWLNGARKEDERPSGGWLLRQVGTSGGRDSVGVGVWRGQWERN